MDFVVLIAIPFLLALLSYGLRGITRPSQQGGVMGAAFALCCAYLLAQLPAITAAPITFSQPWMPQIGLTFTLYVDGLALLFAILVTGIAAAVFFYAGYYFDDGRESGRFLALLAAFTGSMVALVLAGNLLTLFIAWELTSVISFLLISFKGYDPEARRGASQALVVTGGGGLALLVGLLLAGSATGSFEFAEMLASGDVLRQSPLYAGIAALVMLGCFSKSAQFPLHFWLPEAMTAPTPASAFLHSATMVKAGVYLLARFYPVLGDTPLWTNALLAVGLTTMLLGAFLSLRQRDLKAMLAFSTISQLGAFVALIGLPEAHGLKAAMVGILGHALYKCALFLVVGAVEHATGTRDITALGGLRASMPGFAAVTALAALSMAGVPPLLGFVAKETLIEAMLEESLPALIITVLSAIFMVALALRVFVEVFLGAPKTAPDDHDGGHHDGGHHGHAPAPLLVAGPAALAALSLILGLGVTPLVRPLVEPAVGAPISLYLFPPGGINTALLLSAGALLAGAGLFAVRRAWLGLPAIPFAVGPAAFRGVLGAVEAAGDLLLRSQGGKIRYYLVIILVVVVGLLLRVLVNFDRLGLDALTLNFNGVADALKLLLLLLALGATLASIVFRQHLLAALALGIAGYAIGGIFLLEPAPDVALVQFLVETLATVLIIIILARTSAEERKDAMDKVWGQSRPGLLRDVAIAVGMGAAVTLFALAAVSRRPTPNPIADWHLDNAYPLLGVNDVVAGIITDFRGTDTLIEITVFSMAALGVLTLLARPKPGTTLNLLGRKHRQHADDKLKDAIQEDAERPESLMYGSRIDDPITRFIAVPMLAIAMLIAVAQILYAGVGPGDGFTAGVICGLGITIWYVVLGYEETRARLRWMQPAGLVGVGLAIAFINALLPLLAGREFLAFTPIEGLEWANIKFASTLAFEVGICLAVFGGISAILEAISHPREVESL